MKKTKRNANDLAAIDEVNVTFVQRWLENESGEREHISVIMNTFDGMTNLIKVLESRPKGLLEAKVYNLVAKITRRAQGEFAFSDILYSSGYIDKARADLLDEIYL